MRRCAMSGSTWTWRSYAPRTSSRARADGLMGAAGKKHVLLGHRRRPLDVERGHGLHAPGLALRALRLRPHAGLIGVEEERLLDGVLVRAGLDHDAVLEEDVRSPQHVLALVDEIRDVVQP